MTDTAEIIARSLCMAGEAGIDCECEKACETCLVVARVAIAALTEAGKTIVPEVATREMLLAGNKNIEDQANDPEWPTNPPVASCIWEAMIGAGK